MWLSSSTRQGHAGRFQEEVVPGRRRIDGPACSFESGGCRLQTAPKAFQVIKGVAGWAAGRVRAFALSTAKCTKFQWKREQGLKRLVRTPEFGKPEGRTADPSASLGMTKGRVALPARVGCSERAADPPAPLFAFTARPKSCPLLTEKAVNLGNVPSSQLTCHLFFASGFSALSS
jgi:hypothetical protein